MGVTALRVSAAAGVISLISLTALPASGADGATTARPAVSFAGAGPTPTGSDEQSKLWWNDSAWWAVMWHAPSHSFRVFRLAPDGGRWVETGVGLDERARTRSDVLWDGVHLYVASHKFSDRPGLDSPSRLYRLSYDAGTRTYALDPGFPVVITEFRPRVIVLDKDSTGQLWATWTEGGRIYVNRTICDPRCDDRRWGRPFVPPPARERVASGDVASLVAFGGRGIGLMWSNQRVGSFFFAVHPDGAGDAAWERAVTIPKLSADDHISLKADDKGRIVAIVKTSAIRPRDPLNVLLVRDPRSGTWSQAAFGLQRDGHTRSVVLVDEEHDVARVYAAAPTSVTHPDAPRLAIYEKTSPLVAPAFPDGPGRLVIATPEGSVSDATSTKQALTSETGLLLLAADATTKRYWYHHEPKLSSPALALGLLAGHDPPAGVAALQEVADGAAPILMLAAAAALLVVVWIGGIAVRARRRRRRALRPADVAFDPERRESGLARRTADAEAPEESVRRLERERDELESEVDALRMYRRGLERDRVRLESELEARREQCRELERERELRESELETLRLRHGELERECQAAVDTVEALSIRRAELERERESVAAGLERVRAVAEHTHAALDEVLSEALERVRTHAPI